MIAVMSACGNVANSDKEVSNVDSVMVVNDSTVMNDTVAVCDTLQ